MCLGHESSGIIVDVGPSLSSSSSAATEKWKVGDRVAIEAGVPCSVASQFNEHGSTFLSSNAGKANGTSSSTSSCSSSECARCNEGRYNLCPQMRFASSAKTFPHIDGTLQKFINWPAALIHRVPENVSLLAASIVEPLSVVLQGFERARFAASVNPSCSSNQSNNKDKTSVKGNDKSVLILGAGAVGLLACVTAKALGAQFVAAVDIDEGRLAFAKRMEWVQDTFQLPLPSASTTMENSVSSSTDQKVQRKVEDEQSVGAAQKQADTLRSYFTSRYQPATSAVSSKSGLSVSELAAGFDLVLECTGVPSCVQLSILATRPGGRVALIGMGHPIQSAFPIGAAALREVDIIGVFRYANVYPLALQMLADGRIPQTIDERGIENLVSHRFELHQTADAFETMQNGKSKDGKGVVKVFIVDQHLLDADAT